MLIECVRPFARYKRGDLNDIPDACRYDRGHWREVGFEANRVTEVLAVVEITPEQALGILATAMGGIPSEDQEIVQRYRAHMDAGKWTDASMLLFEDGRLCNGHHRMVALSGAEAPQLFRIPEDQIPNTLRASDPDPPNDTQAS